MNLSIGTRISQILSINLFAVFISFTLNATNYYVSNNGNDNANGISTETSWKTVAKLNSKILNVGDSVFFKCGDVWRETLKVSSSGELNNYIFFGSYGTGEKPQIIGSDLATGFVHISGNIWASTSKHGDPYMGYGHEIIFEKKDGSISWGRVRRNFNENFSDLTREYEWTWNDSTIYLFFYTDPNTKFSEIEIPQRDNCILIDNQDYISFDNLYLAYSKLSGIRDPYQIKGPNGNRGFTITNCEICYIGKKGSSVGYGIYLKYSDMIVRGCEFHNCGRRSLTTMASSSTTGSIYRNNILVENCTFHNGFHTTGLDIGTGSLTGVLNNFVIRNNLFYENPDYDPLGEEGFPSNFIYLENDNGHKYTNFYIYNNIFHTHVGKGITCSYVDTMYIDNNTFYGFNQFLLPPMYQGFIYVGKYMTELHIRNNITYNNANYSQNDDLMNFYVNKETNTYQETEANYNLYYNTDVRTPMVIADGHRWNINEWENYKAYTGWDLNSPTPSNPLFVNAPEDLSLSGGSPAIGVGITIPWIKTDFYGKTMNNPPDLGAIQYSGNTAGIHLMFPIDDLLIYPNPATGVCNLLVTYPGAESYAVKIYNVQGQLIYESNLFSGTNNIAVPITQLSSGLYFIGRSVKSTFIDAKKLIVRNN